MSDLAHAPATICPVDLLDPGKEAVAQAWTDVHAAAQRELFGDRGSAYSLAEHRGLRRMPGRRWADRSACLGNELVGALAVALPTSDNRDAAFITLSVRPEAWRRGVGGVLLAEAERIAGEEGRRILMVESQWPVDGNDVAEDFARSHGYEVAQTSLRSEMRLPMEPAALRAVLEVDDDYVLESWVDEMPETWLTERAALSQRMSTDAPLDDLALEEEAWDAERLRQTLARSREVGRRMVETVARHVPSGALVGFTQVSAPIEERALAYQQDTLVLSEHRGHGLGLRLKAANALLVMDVLPAVRTVRTWNSATNEHMLAVNRDLGYVVDGYEREWQKVLA